MVLADNPRAVGWARAAGATAIRVGPSDPAGTAGLTIPSLAHLPALLPSLPLARR